MTTIKRIHHLRELFFPRRVPRTLLGVFAHPDDEALLAGGTFALAHTEGIRSTLVTATQGELGGKYSGIYGQKLARLRTRELAAATAILHIGTSLLLTIPDKGAGKSRADLKDKLINIIAKNKPQIILTHDLFDAYQHPDHIATARATVDAVKEVNPSWPHVIWFAAFKPNADRLTYALDIDACRDIKIQACRAHVSQGLLHAKRSSIPITVYYEVNHFEYFVPYEKETTTDDKRHHPDKK